MCETSTKSTLFDIETTAQIMCSGLLFFVNQNRGDEMIGLLTAAPHTVPGVISFTIEQLWQMVLAIAGGITAIAAAVTVIVKTINKMREPDKQQNEKIKEHEQHLDSIDGKLKNDKDMLDIYRSKILALEEHQKEQDITIEDYGRKIAGVEQRVNRSEHGINVMMKALLALLSHGIDGNAIDPMKEAKADLENFLIGGQNLKDI